MFKSFFSAFVCLVITHLAQAQSTPLDQLQSNGTISSNSPLNGIPFKNIGPTVMSGRVTDIEVNPNNTTEFYVAYASGGVFHTVNNGLSFTPIFDHEASITVGDMAMDWNTRTLWVGTGEVNSSRSSYAGTGVYVTQDNGKTWKHRGLEESHHIGKIELVQKQPNTLLVGVLGHLYTHNKERGIYKTTDGGQTWKQTLYINDSTGCVDLIADPLNHMVYYAATWTRSRTAWNFNGVGEGSGIYKSTDGGDHWTLLTNEQAGFPIGKNVGRIGLSISRSNPQIVYALLDNNFNQDEKEDEKEPRLTARELSTMSDVEFFKIEDKKIQTYLKTNGYPKKYTAENVKESVRQKKYTIKDIADWKLADADANLFNTPVKGAELYRSNDGGKTWNKTHSNVLEGVYFTYGYYFGTLAVSPLDPNKVWIAGYPILSSNDGGKTFKQIDGENCHPDYHRIWVNPNNDQHLITGNDGGINITYDAGQIWYKANNPAVGQFYAIAVDQADPYNVYGGLQDNGTWAGPANHNESVAWQQSGEYAYKGIGDGDGMQVQVDTRTNNEIYLGYQFGNYFKYNKAAASYDEIKPVHDIGQKPFRFNWQTPIHLSKHNQDIFYMGSNCFHRSLQQGEKLETLSADLTSTKHKGNVPYGTLTSIHESPLRFGLLYVSTDDGNVHCSKDVGYTWTSISAGLPKERWVSRVLASQHQEGVVYCSLNGYRNDDFEPYVFMSSNYGTSWTSIAGNLPNEPVNVVREDPKNPRIIYIGTDNGLYVSFDQGKTYTSWTSELPRVAIHDIAIQERENEIVLGTHGRSLYISKLDLIQEYAKVNSQTWALFKLNNQNWNSRLGSKYASYAEPVSDKLPISFYTKQAGDFSLNIYTEKNKLAHTIQYNAKEGINTIAYNFQLDESALTAWDKKPNKADDGNYYLPAGKYTVELVHPNGEKKTQLVELSERK
jgi:photosystem II stability/assembly factor-like uncharacterized protein